MASSVDNNASEDLIEVKDWFLLGTDLESLGHREFLQYANDHLGTSANLSAWDEYFKGKNIALDLALNWDHSKNTETNLAEMSVNQVEAITFGALVGLVSKNAFLGVLAGFGFSTLAKKLGLDGEGVVEHLKKYLQDHPEVSNSLTPEEKKKLEESGFLFPKPKTIEVSVVSMGDRYESQGAITFKVILSAPLTQPITIDLVTLDGSAQMGSDYYANSHVSVTIPAGSRVGYYSVPLKDDDAGEETESFTVAPYNVSYYGRETIFLKSAGYGVILDDDGKGDGDDGYYDNIPVASNQNFSSPLVLDLNGDGVTSTFIYDTQTYFDLNNDGIRERTAWTQNGDGILVFDKNQDGMINNGNELFGNNTILKNGTKAANGFEALKEYDENRDYVIDNSDNIYHALKIWQDSNRDGISQANELTTLEEMNIQAIGVIYADTESYEGQNVARQRSFFIGENADGSWKAGMVNDVWFETNNRDTARNTDVTLKDSVSALPDYRGAGRVDNLSVAMNENTKLESAVTALLSKASTATYDSLLSDTKNILALWTKTDNIDSSMIRGEQWILNHNYSNVQSTGWRYRVYAYARDISILESFWGQNFTMTVDGKTTSDVIGTEMSAYMTDAINTLTDTVLATLLVQQLYGKDAYDVTNGSFDYNALFTKLDTTLTTGSTEDKTTAANLLATLIHRDGLETLSNLDTTILDNSAFKILLQANNITYTVGADGVISGSYTGNIEGTSGNDTIQATTDGKVYGGDGDDIIRGTDGSYSYSPTGNATGHEELHGGEGNDTIIGGSGDDILYGDAGDDTLYANSTDGRDGYGHDFLIGGKGNDTLLGTTRNSTYVYSYGDGHDIIIDGGNVGVTSDVLELRNIRFEDVIVGSSGNDMVIRIKDIVDLESDSGSITIKNGMGSGKIEQYVFDDRTVDFSKLQLLTQGLLKDDTYLFNRADGSKFIIDYASLNGDTLQFAEGITADNIEIKISSSSNDLIIALKEEGKTFSALTDKLTIINWFNPDNRIEIFSFGDGTVWDANTILAHQGTDEADTTRLLDTTSGITLSLGDGSDTITTGSGNDTLVGGTGDDTLSGGSGNDTYMFNRGDGQDILSDTGGMDSVCFGEGIGSNDLALKAVVGSNDLIIALKEGEIAFEALSDTIVLKNWFITGSRIESFHFTDGTIWNVNDIISTQATEGDDGIRGLDMDLSTHIHLLGGNDTIVSGNAADMIYGDDGDDTLQTQGGNDILDGGIGNDSLQGGGGDDTYVYERGDGTDTITDEGRYAPYYWNTNYTIASDGGTDTLYFGDTITASDLIVKASANSNDLIVALKEGNTAFEDLTDKITLKNWFNSDNRIESFSFSDGTTWDVNDIVNAQGTEDADTVHLVDSFSDVVLNLRGGDDVVTTVGGNDTLIGGIGNDTLNGGAGDDTYVFAKGDGVDTITDVSGDDTLQFAEGISANDLIVKASANSNDLIVALKEDGKTFAELSDKITLKNWFNADDRIENFTFIDGTVLDTLGITELQTTDSNENYLRYLDHDNTINAHEGNDTIEGGAGNDTYIFNRGDGTDQITDITGVDTLLFGVGIASENLEVHMDNNYLIIALKEEDKRFDELSDKVCFKRIGIDDYGIENLTFEDGNSIDARSLISTYNGTDGSDTIDLAYLQSINPTVLIDDNLIINAKGGSDTITIGNGSNTIDMGDGYFESLNVGNGDNTIHFNSKNLQATIGDGNNSIIENIKNYDDLYAFYGGGYFDVTIGDGNNTIQLGQHLSKELPFDFLLSRYGNITLGDGNNQISIKNGDGYIDIRSGSGNNTIEFSADMDQVYINYAGEDTFTDNADGDNTITQLEDSDVDYLYYDYYGGRGAPIEITNSNTVAVGLGNGNNRISLSDVAQDYRLKLGEGNNTITIGKEGSNNNYAMESKITVGDGDNILSILSGEGTLSINAGSGDNRIEFSGDIDHTHFSFEGGNNTFVQLDSINNNIGYSYVDITGSTTNTIVLGDSSTLLMARNNRGNTISSGAGADDIYTNGSDDTYHVTFGDGTDALLDRNGYDTIVFGEGISKENLKVSVAFYSDLLNNTDNVAILNDFTDIINSDGLAADLLMHTNLVIQYGNNPADKLILLDWYAQEGRIERFEFADGSVLSDHQIVDLIGTETHDTVLGTEGDNKLHGGAGEDNVSGNEGNDTYRFNRGDSHDIFTEDGGFDTVAFGAHISKDDLILQKVDNSLLVSLKEEGKTINDLTDTIRIADWFDESGRIERFTFADGSSMELDEMLSLVDAEGLIYYGTPDIDVMEGTLNSDVIMARESDDIVNGNGGNDLLFTEPGNDTLNGGEGDDLLYGGEGDDTYIIDRNQGNDRIFDLSGSDTLRFAEGIVTDDIKVWYENNDLMIEVEGTITRLTDWYKSKNRIETFALDEGTVLSVQEIMALMISNGDDAIRTLEEGSRLDAGAGDDTIAINIGNDTLYGGEGNDTYLITRFQGTDIIDDVSGSDTIHFGPEITPDLLRVTWVQGSEDILIQSKTSDHDTLILKNWYNADNRIETILFDDGTVWNVQDIINAMGSDEDDVYDGFKEQANVISAKGGNDIVSTFGYDDVLYGGAGNDALDSGSGDDILSGGEGDDLLFGGAGNDTYVFDREFGKDMIYENALDGIEAGNDRILFGKGIGYDDLIVKSFENDPNLYIALAEGDKLFEELSNVLTIKDWFLSNARIESIFLNETDEIAIVDLMRSKASDNNDPIFALGEGGELIGTDNDDYLVGNVGDDFILGLNGSDTLIGGSGNDTLIGGEGDDLLEGGGNNDIYFFNRGEGKDIVYDNASAVQEQYGYVTDAEGIARWSKIEQKYSVNGGMDSIFFGEKILPSDLIVTNEGLDLVITFNGSMKDRLRIKDYYNPFNSIEYFGFSDGMIMEKAEFETLLFTPDNDNVTFVDDQERTLYGGNGDDTINGGSGNDSIDGGAGDDTLNGGFGDDTYYFGRGSGHDTITDSGVGQWWQTRSGSDVLVLKDSLGIKDLIRREIGNDIVIGIREEGKGFDELNDTLTIKGALDGDTFFESVTLGNGTTVNMEMFLNHTPKAISEVSHTLQDFRILSGEVEATDLDGDVLTYTVSTAVSHGELSVDENGGWNYTAAEGYMGIDSAVITVDDGNGGSVTQTLVFDLQVSTPTLSDSVANLMEDTSATGTFDVTNPIGGTLIYEVINASAKGSFTVSEIGNWNYTPSADLNGDDSVMIKVTNSYGLSTTATLNLAIEAVNDVPVTLPVTLPTVAEDSGTIIVTAEQLLSSASDVDNDTLSVIDLSVSEGTLIDNHDGTWALELTENYNGTIALSYAVSDGTVQIDTTAIQTVTSVNDAPILLETPASAILYAGASISGNIKASDIDGDTLSYRVTTDPAHGTLSINESGVWNYRAERYYAGESSATVIVDDGYGGSVSTTLNFTNLMTPDWHYTYSGQSMNINDSDGDDLLIMDTVSMTELTFLHEGNNLRIDVKDKNDVILTDYFASISKGIESIQTLEGNINLSKSVIKNAKHSEHNFKDSGTNELIIGQNKNDHLNGKSGDDILFGNTKNDKLFGDEDNDLLIGGEGNDFLSGGEDSDILYGDNGNDYLFGDNGNDCLFGGNGNDVLLGNLGNDLLHGGEGKNQLSGGEGDDIYFFTKGANTTVIDEDIKQIKLFGKRFWQNGGFDTIKFGQGIDQEDILFLMKEHDLILQYGENESITIKNQDNAAERIEKIELSNGSYLSNTDIEIIIQQLSAYSKDYAGGNDDYCESKNIMMSIITNSWHQ